MEVSRTEAQGDMFEGQQSEYSLAGTQCLYQGAGRHEAEVWVEH